jgi:hypothetical protein
LFTLNILSIFAFETKKTTVFEETKSLCLSREKRRKSEHKKEKKVFNLQEEKTDKKRNNKTT